MNKNIGILTYHNANNYGAVLQAFALSHTLKELYGDESAIQIIDYDSPSMPLKEKQIGVFREFCNEYLPVSKPVATKNELARYISSNSFDAIIAGSDQVWNLSLNGNDTTYFLDFVHAPVKKFSYAASIGSNQLNESVKKRIPELLSSFDKISLREKSHLQFIQDSVNCPVCNTLDPSLLLTAKDYTKHFNLESGNEKYIFLFYFQADPFLIDLANLLSVYKGIKLIAITGYDNCMFVNGTKTPGNVSPENWLQLIKNASMVLTDSFHCTAFSIIFRRPFYTYTQRTGNSVRLLDLLREFQLSERNLSKLFNISDIDLACDYSKSEDLIETKRKESLEYLRKLF
ncbi:MAG: polysaccharide pyruvyl transferase family protein [Lachnospiraceae bacterium]